MESIRIFFWPFLVQKSKNPHYNNLFIFRFFSKIISMRIFVFLNIFCRQKIPFWRKLMVFYFFIFRIFFKNYTKWDLHVFVDFFTSKKYVFSAKNENEKSNFRPKFACYFVIKSSGAPSDSKEEMSSKSQGLFPDVADDRCMTP